MADGYQRVRARKKIKFQSGQTIYIPVITKLNVVDQNGQEVEVNVLNTSENTTREVHVDRLSSTRHPGYIDVERIDDWIGLDIVDKAQESKFIIDNKTGADSRPPSFTTHQKTHVYRYYQNPNVRDDNGIWIDAELIDELSVVDQNGQEHVYFLIDNPEATDSSGQADSGDPDLTGDTDSGIDPPYRTDPFQNIIDFNDESPGTGGFLVLWMPTTSFNTVGLVGDTGCQITGSGQCGYPTLMDAARIKKHGYTETPPGNTATVPTWIYTLTDVVVVATTTCPNAGNVNDPAAFDCVRDALNGPFPLEPGGTCFSFNGELHGTATGYEVGTISTDDYNAL